MEERDKKTELLVGLFLLVGMLLLGLLILQFGAVRELFKTTYEITAPFPDGTGIKEGTPIMLGGSKIGKVPRLPKLNDQFNGVIIAMEIYHDKKIPTDAKFSIGTAGLLGDSFIEIRPTGATAGTYIEPGAVLTKENVAGTGGMGALADTAKDLSKKVDVAVDELKVTLKAVQLSLKNVNEGALSAKSMEDLKGTFAHLNSVMTRLDEKTLGESTSKDIKDAVASFKSAAEALEASVKKIDPAAGKLDGVMTKLDGAAAKADTVMASANKAVKTIDTSAEALGKVATDLRKGSGLLPSLIYDSEMKTEFKALITNMRQHGILFYKDRSGMSQAEDAPRPPMVGTRR